MEPVPLSTEQTTEYLLVDNGTISIVGQNNHSKVNNFDYSVSEGVPVSLVTTKYEYAGVTHCDIDLENVGEVQEENDKLAVANYVLKNIFQYTDDEISSIDDDQKIDIADASNISFQAINIIYKKDGTELILSDLEKDKFFQQMRATDSDEYYDGTIRSTLTATIDAAEESGSASLTTSVDGPVLGLGHNQFHSICIQNVACDGNASRTTGYYYGGASGLTRYNINMDENSDGYDAIGGASGGSGIRYVFDIPNSTSYSNVKDAFVYTYVPFDNSSVEDGQWFNIYGNFGVSSITLIGAGVGFPWGFSLDIAGNISEHETNFRMQF